MTLTKLVSTTNLKRFDRIIFSGKNLNKKNKIPLGHGSTNCPQLLQTPTFEQTPLQHSSSSLSSPRDLDLVPHPQSDEQPDHSDH